MPRRNHYIRSLREIFDEANNIGGRNVLLNDGEYGAVLAGSDQERYSPGSIGNMRTAGRLRSPIVRVGRTPKTRLTDALEELERMTNPAKVA